MAWTGQIWVQMPQPPHRCVKRAAHQLRRVLPRQQRADDAARRGKARPQAREGRIGTVRKQDKRCEQTGCVRPETAAAQHAPRAAPERCARRTPPAAAPPPRRPRPGSAAPPSRPAHQSPRAVRSARSHRGRRPPRHTSGVRSRPCRSRTPHAPPAAPAARTRCAPRRRRSPCPRCAGSRPSFLPPPFVIYQLVSKKDSTLPQFCQGAAWIFPAI